MSFIQQFLGAQGFVAVAVAGNTLLEKNNNEIKFDNFIQQAEKRKILIKHNENETCKQYAIMGNTIEMKNAYDVLYDYLVEKNIITSTVDKASLWTWDKVYKVNKDLVKQTTLSKLDKEKDYPEQLKCYKLNGIELYHFLNTYVYSGLNKFKNIGLINSTPIHKVKTKSNRAIHKVKTKSNRAIHKTKSNHKLKIPSKIAIRI